LDILRTFKAPPVVPRRGSCKRRGDRTYRSNKTGYCIHCFHVLRRSTL